jgi:hypothetical protein
MSLTTNLYFFGADYDRQPFRREIMDALVARLPEAEQRRRIRVDGAVRVAFSDFNWLLNERDAATLLDPPVEAFTTAVRRFGDPPVFLNPLDLLRRFHALGWIPDEQFADLPPEALGPPKEEEAISLDRVISRFFPTGSGALEDDGGKRTAAMLQAIEAHVAEQRAPHGTLGGPNES